MAGLLNNPNVLALKGPVTAQEEMLYGQRRPKALGVTREILAKAGITDIPESGILDPTAWDDARRDVLMPQLDALKDLVSGPKEQVEEFRLQFASLGDRRKIEIPGIGKMYRNVHPNGFEVTDENGRIVEVTTMNNTPVTTSGVKILGVDKKTVEDWGKIINGASSVIVLGDSTGVEKVLAKTYPDQRRIFGNQSQQIQFKKWLQMDFLGISQSHQIKLRTLVVSI